MDWLAAESGGTDLGTLTNYGVTGLLAALGIMFFKVAYKRETDRSDRLEEKNDKLNEIIQERAIPALEQASRAIQESQELLRDMQATRERERREK